jgi:hypothetical protein
LGLILISSFVTLKISMECKLNIIFFCFLFLIFPMRVEAQSVVSERYCDAPYTDCDWQFHANNPIIVPNSTDGDKNIYAPDVMYENGVYRMWYGGQGGSHDRIYHTTSINGVNWGNKQLVLDLGSSNHNNDPSVVKVSDLYYMFYTDNNIDQMANYGDTIHLATSNNGIDWTKRGLVLDKGAPGEWDASFASRPSVIYEDGIFKMWYDSCPLACFIGYAESEDGYNWTKYTSNPLIYGSGIDVEHLTEGYVMLSQSGYDGPLIRTSADGISWTDHGYIFRLSGKSYDTWGHVTPNIFINEDRKWVGVYFGGASVQTWDRNTIGLAYLPYPSTPPFNIQGLKKYCPENTKVILDGTSEVTSEPYIFVGVTGVPHTISLELPAEYANSGYDILHSVCDGCIQHPISSFVLGNPLSFEKLTDTLYYDLYWKCSALYDLDYNGVYSDEDMKLLFENWGKEITNKIDIYSDSKINSLDFSKVISETENL